MNNKIIYIILLTAFTNSHPNFLKPYNGMVAIDMGDTFIEKGTLTLNYDLSPPPELVSLLCTLRMHILDTSFLSVTWPQKIDLGEHPTSQNHMQLLDSLAKKIKGIFSSNYLFRDQEDACNITTPVRLTRRSKRGLINLGGDLLKFLFGTVVEDDIKDFQDKTRTLSRNVQLVMDETKRHIKQINNNFDQLKRAHEKSDRELYYLHFDTFLLKANDVLEETKTSLILVDSVISSAIQHTTHPTILPFKDFKKIVEEGTTSLRLSPLLPLTFQYYYQYLALCSVHYIGNEFSIQINIPYSDDVKYETYLAQPFPNIRSKDYYLELDGDPSVIAKSTHHHFQLTLLEFEQCKHANSFTLCQTRNKKSLTESCLINLLQNSSNNNCQYIKRPQEMISNDPAIVTFEGNSIVNFGNNNTKASIACAAHQKTIIVADIIYVPNTCSLISDKLTILPKVAHNYKRLMKIPVTQTFFNLPSTSLDRFKNTSITLETLSNNLHGLDSDENFIHAAHIISTYVLYFLIISLTISFVSFHMYRRRQRRIRHEHIARVISASRRNSGGVDDLIRTRTPTPIPRSPSVGRRSRAPSPPLISSRNRNPEVLPTLVENVCQETQIN